MALDIKITKKKDYAYSVGLKGSIDTETSPDLEEELKEIIDDKIKALVFDMGGVDYISSFGVRAIMWAKKTLKAKNATFAMVNLKPQIEKVFEVMKILPMLDIFDDMTEADMYIDQVIKEEIVKQSK